MKHVGAFNLIFFLCYIIKVKQLYCLCLLYQPPPLTISCPRDIVEPIQLDCFLGVLRKVDYCRSSSSELCEKECRSVKISEYISHMGVIISVHFESEEHYFQY